MGTLTLAARAFVAVVLATAGATKLLNPASLLKTVLEFGAGKLLSRLSVALPAAELAVAISLVIEPTARWAAIAAALLVLLFILGIANAMRLGRRPDCGCFGALSSEPIGPRTLIRNGVLLLLSGFIVGLGPGPSVARWSDMHSSAMIVFVVCADLLLLGAWFGASRLWPAHELPQTNASGSPSRTPIVPGDAAPQFATTDTEGNTYTLETLVQPGRTLVLIFGSSGCGTCVTLFEQLAGWKLALEPSLQLAVVSPGDPAWASPVRERYNLAPVLLDPDSEISRRFAVRITPTAYAITDDRRIANGPALGPDAIEDLIRLRLQRIRPKEGPWQPMIQPA